MTIEGTGGDSSAGIRLLVRLARALADIHVAGVAHRDLKPANVLLGEHGPLLTDFGLCFDPDDPDTRLTGSDEAVGSWLYIAPENEGGFNEDADQGPADFYAFGKTMWAVLTGRRPLAREAITEDGNRLVNVLEDANLSSLDVLIRDLTNRDPRVRLKDWEVVIRELTTMGRVLTGEGEEVPNQ